MTTSATVRPSSPRTAGSQPLTYSPGCGAILDEAAKVLHRLTVEELLAPYEIQGYHVRGLDAVYQVVEHFGLHYGQIVYIAKSLLSRDLGFYKELSKTGRAD